MMCQGRKGEGRLVRDRPCSCRRRHPAHSPSRKIGSLAPPRPRSRQFRRKASRPVKSPLQVALGGAQPHMPVMLVERIHGARPDRPTVISRTLIQGIASFERRSGGTGATLMVVTDPSCGDIDHFAAVTLDAVHRPRDGSCIRDAAARRRSHPPTRTAHHLRPAGHRTSPAGPVVGEEQRSGPPRLSQSCRHDPMTSFSSRTITKPVRPPRREAAHERVFLQARRRYRESGNSAWMKSSGMPS